MSDTGWQRARRIAREAGLPLDRVEMPLPEAVGAPLVALSPLPAHDAAAMDGYAVAGSGPWRVTGRVLAGDPTPVEALEPGYAVEIGTGAVVPAGADPVLPYGRANHQEIAGVVARRWFGPMLTWPATATVGTRPYRRPSPPRPAPCRAGSARPASPRR